MRFIAPLVCAISLLGAMPGARAAGASHTSSAEDIRWVCQQPSAARIRIVGVGVRAPDKPCTRDRHSAADKRCRVAVVDAIVLESLPTLGTQPGLPATTGYPPTPFRFAFRPTSRDYRVIPALSSDLVGTEGLVASREWTSAVAGEPDTLPIGAFVPTHGPASQSLDELCKPFRHWSGQAHPELPEPLPGHDPSALDGEDGLAKALASLIADQPPEPSAIERRFGTPLLAAFPPKDGRSLFHTLVRLPQRWIRIERQGLRRANGRESVNMTIEMMQPYAYPGDRPWWSPLSGQAPEMGYCITPWMLFSQLGPGWLPPPMQRHFSFTEGRRDARYDVTVIFPDMQGPSFHGPPPVAYSPYRCIREFLISYDERPVP